MIKKLVFCFLVIPMLAMIVFSQTTRKYEQFEAEFDATGKIISIRQPRSITALCEKPTYKKGVITAVKHDVTYKNDGMVVDEFSVRYANGKFESFKTELFGIWNLPPRERQPLEKLFARNRPVIVGVTHCGSGYFKYLDSIRDNSGQKSSVSKETFKALSTTDVDEFSVALGETANRFNFTNKGALTYNGKRFVPVVIVNPRDVTKFEISMLKQKGWAGAIAADVDGQNTLYFLDILKMTATPMQKRGAWNAAKKIYWSPSLRYMVALCAYEGQSFVRIDIKTKIVRDVGVSYTEPGNNYETILSITDEPRWSGNKDVLVFNVNKYCNPYEGNCGENNINVNRVLASYKISLNAATLKMTYGR